MNLKERFDRIKTKTLRKERVLNEENQQNILQTFGSDLDISIIVSN